MTSNIKVHLARDLLANPTLEVVHLQPGHLAVVPVGGVGRLDDVEGLRPNSIDDKYRVTSRLDS